MNIKIKLLFYTVLIYSIGLAQHIENHWVRQSQGVFNTLEDVDFYNDDYGCAVGIWGSIGVTTNGGQSWVKKNFNTTTFNAVQQVTENNIYITGGNNIFFSSDRGENWTNQISTLGISTDLRDIFFIDSLRGWAVGSENTILRTIDAGNNWEVLDSDLPPSQENWLMSVFFTSPNIGWVVGGDNTDTGVVLNTTNGGDTWSSVDVGISLWFNKVYFQNEMKGWVLGSDQTILQTIDGGLSWNSKNTPMQSDAFTVISFSTENVGWLVGGNSILFKTTDNGETWTNVEGTPSSINAIHFSSEGNGWLVGGDFGNVSPPAGQIWTYDTDLSTQDNSISKIQLYPNPSSDIIKIDLSENNIGESIEVFNLQGKQILSSTIINTQTEINVSNYERGMYFLKIGNQKTKFIKN